MSNENLAQESRWLIPFNTGYDGFKKIVITLYQKAHSASIPVDKLADYCVMNQNTVSVNMNFLKAISIAEGDKTGFKLTTIGSEYAKALIQEDSASISKTTNKIIDGSHLKDLKDFIEANKKDLTAEKMYKFIKSIGKFSDGDNHTSMTLPYGNGAKTLLLFFKDAGILPKEFNEVGNASKKISSRESNPANGKKVRIQQGAKKIANKLEHGPDSDFFYLGSDNFKLSVKRSLSKDELEHVRAQISLELDFLAQKIGKENSS